jgi:hypothetical protein
VGDIRALGVLLGLLAAGLALVLPIPFAFRTGLQTYLSRVQASAEEPPCWIEEHLPLKGRWLRAFLYAPGALVAIFGIWLAMIAIPLLLLVAVIGWLL